MKSLYLILYCATIWIACTEAVIEPTGEANIIIEEDDQIFIIDRSGYKWDITHAVRKYGFKSENFQFGLGPNAVPPINEPDYILPGEAGYPSANSDIQVIGTKINNISRAYPLFVMKSHEIVNEQFGESFVSVAY